NGTAVIAGGRTSQNYPGCKADADVGINSNIRGTRRNRRLLIVLYYDSLLARCSIPTVVGYCPSDEVCTNSKLSRSVVADRNGTAVVTRSRTAQYHPSCKASSNISIDRHIRWTSDGRNFR